MEGNIVQSLTKHALEYDQFMKTSEHLKVVLDRFSDIDKVDRNDLYELVYAEEEIEYWLKSDIENETIRANLQDLLDMIQNITKYMSDNQIKKILNNRLKNKNKLDKSRYNKADPYKGLKDKKKRQLKSRLANESPMAIYLKSRAVPFLMVNALMLFMISGGASKISEMIVSILLRGDSTNVLESSSVSTVMSMLSSIMVLLIMIAGMFTMLNICIQLTWLAIPVIRAMGIFDRFISEDVRYIVENSFQPAQEMEKEVDTRDKTEIAEALLHNMIFRLEQNKTIDKKKMYLPTIHGIPEMPYYDIANDIHKSNDENKRFYYILLSIDKALKAIKDLNLDKIKLLVKSELLYNNNREKFTDFD